MPDVLEKRLCFKGYFLEGVLDKDKSSDGEVAMINKAMTTVTRIPLQYAQNVKNIKNIQIMLNGMDNKKFISLRIA